MFDCNKMFDLRFLYQIFTLLPICDTYDWLTVLCYHLQLIET